MPGQKRNPASQDDALASYAGRWVARFGNQIVGQGGTPEQALRAAQAVRHKEKPEIIYVPTSHSLNLPELLGKLSASFPSDQKIYLVGGAVRDAMLSRPVHDLDFVLSGNAIRTARLIADRLRSAFFVLDEEHDAARIVMQIPGQDRIFLDFTGMRGSDLESDLRARDFTINAMALGINAPQALLDPLGGAADLRSKQIRACSPASLINDPLRIVRGVRMAAAFGFHIQTETRQLMRQSVSLLPRVSSERLRDEFFKILDGPQPATALRALDILGVFHHILPDLITLKGVEQSAPHIFDVWNHTLAVVQKLDDVFAALDPKYDPDKADNLALGLLVMKLGRFRQNVGEHLKTSLNPDRTLRALIMLAALYHDIAKPQTRKVEEDGRVRFFEHDVQGVQIVQNQAYQFHLSNAEIQRLQIIVRHHLRPLLLTQSDDLPSRRAIFRFFNDTGVAGVDICLLSLADTLATYGHTLPTKKWAAHLDVVRSLLEAWWENPEQSVAPPILLNGHEIMEFFNLKPGVKVGELLNALREAQAIGKVKNRDEALAYLKDLL